MACCKAKVTHMDHSGVEKILIPGAHFSHMHVDLQRWFNLPADYDHRSTRWPEAVPLGCIDVDTVLEEFIWRSVEDKAGQQEEQRGRRGSGEGQATTTGGQCLREVNILYLNAQSIVGK